MRNPIVATLSAVVLIVAAAFATLAVLSAYAGERSGLEKSGRTHCATLSPAQARDVANPDYGRRLAALARCR